MMVLLMRMVSVIRSRCYCSAAPVSVAPVERIRKRGMENSKRQFTDKIRIHVRGGTGGMGCPTAGGIGGNGGNIFIKCVNGASLSQYYPMRNRRIVANHGPNYVKGRLTVKSGNDKYISVPPGTEIKSGRNVLICDMDKIGHTIKIVNGGVGGSSKTPDFNGQKGERKIIAFELKTIADASLTGFPNAGKSSLLRVLSRSSPKVGSYPFTTINPMVGSIFYNDDKQVQVADLPGLIEDAHLNKGMGHKFLRHIERTKMVVLVIDIDGFQLHADSHYRTPLETMILLLRELSLYQELLLSRPFLLVLNKMDVEGALQKRDVILNEVASLDASHYLLNDFEYGEIIASQIKQFADDDFADVFSVSAKDATGLHDLKIRLHEHIHGEKSLDEYFE